MESRISRSTLIKTTLCFVASFVLFYGVLFWQLKSLEINATNQVVAERGAVTERMLHSFSSQLSHRVESIKQTAFLFSDYQLVQYFFVAERDEKQGIVTSLQDALHSIHVTNPDLYSIRMIDLDGKVLLRSDHQKNPVYSLGVHTETLETQSYLSLTRMLSMNEVGVYVGDEGELSKLDEPHIVVVAPVYDGTFSLGYVVLTLSLQDMIDLELKRLGSDKAFMLLLSQTGRYLYGEAASLLYGRELILPSDYSFSEDFPETWARMSKWSDQDKPELVSEENQYFMVKPYHIEFENEGEYRGWLVAYFSESDISGLLNQKLEYLAPWYMWVLWIALIVAMLVSLIVYRRSVAMELSLMAQAVMRSMSPIIIFDTKQRVMQVNDEFVKLTGLTSDVLLGKQFLSVIKDVSDEYEKCNFVWQELLKGGIWKGEIEFRNRNKESIEGLLELHPLKLRNDRIEGYVATLSDISEQKKLERKLRSLTVTDALTGCRNRRFFDDELRDQYEKLKRFPNQSFCLALLDIDFFKRVNDEFGHDVGDEVLQAFAMILEKEMRTVDIVCRVGGEEFAVILSNTSIDDAAVVMERLRERIELADMPHTKITSSFGLASSLDAQDEETLYKRADRALYTAKSNGRNQVVVAE